MEDNEATQRRLQLHELDQLLDGLERLNLQDAHEMPGSLREGLVRFGLHVPAQPNFTQLIEAVWELQERLLTPGQGVESSGGPIQRAPEGH